MPQMQAQLLNLLPLHHPPLVPPPLVPEPRPIFSDTHCNDFAMLGAAATQWSVDDGSASQKMGFGMPFKPTLSCQDWLNVTICCSKTMNTSVNVSKPPPSIFCHLTTQLDKIEERLEMNKCLLEGGKEKEWAIT